MVGAHDCSSSVGDCTGDKKDTSGKNALTVVDNCLSSGIKGTKNHSTLTVDIGVPQEFLCFGLGSVMLPGFESQRLRF